MFGVNVHDCACTYVWLYRFNSSIIIIVTVQINNIATMYSVLGIRIKNLSAVFEDRTFCRLLIAIPLKMYRKFGCTKSILVGQMLKLVRSGQWP